MKLNFSKEKKLFAHKVRELLEYDPKTGKFTWLVNLNPKAFAGGKAGYVSGRGYAEIKIFGEFYYQHRLAWLWMTGEWPKNRIDHKNNIRTDNRWENLREAEFFQNNGNRPSMRTKKSGLPKGVYVYQYGEGKYIAQLHRKHLGIFATVEEAAKAYEKAAKARYGEFFRA